MAQLIKMCMYCSMNKQYVKGIQKQSYLSLEILPYQLCYNHKAKKSPSVGLEAKSLFCSMNRDKETYLIHSKNGDKRGSRWIMGLIHDDKISKDMSPDPKSKGGNYFPPLHCYQIDSHYLKIDKRIVSQNQEEKGKSEPKIIIMTGNSLFRKKIIKTNVFDFYQRDKK